MLVAATDVNTLLYAAPLVVATCLVYAATRSERLDRIVKEAVGLFLWFAVAAVVLIGVLTAITYPL